VGRNSRSIFAKFQSSKDAVQPLNGETSTRSSQGYGLLQRGIIQSRVIGSPCLDVEAVDLIKHQFYFLVATTIEH